MQVARPSTSPQPVMTPSAGASTPSIARWAKCGRPWTPSSTKVPSSTSRSIRSGRSSCRAHAVWRSSPRRRRAAPARAPRAAARSARRATPSPAACGRSRSISLLAKVVPWAMLLAALFLLAGNECLAQAAPPASIAGSRLPRTRRGAHGPIAVAADRTRSSCDGEGARQDRPLPGRRRPVRRLRKALEDAGFEGIPDPRPSSCADCFYYDIVYRGHSVGVHASWINRGTGRGGRPARGDGRS